MKKNVFFAVAFVCGALFLQDVCASSELSSLLANEDRFSQDEGRVVFRGPRGRWWVLRNQEFLRDVESAYACCDFAHQGLGFRQLQQMTHMCSSTAERFARYDVVASPRDGELSGPRRVALQARSQNIIEPLRSSLYMLSVFSDFNRCVWEQGVYGRDAQTEPFRQTLSNIVAACSTEREENYMRSYSIKFLRGQSECLDFSNYFRGAFYTIRGLSETLLGSSLTELEQSLEGLSDEEKSSIRARKGRLYIPAGFALGPFLASRTNYESDSSASGSDSDQDLCFDFEQ